MPNRIQDLRELGYDVGFAHGSVEVEHQALADAQENAQPGVLTDQAQAVTHDTVSALDKQGKLPEDPGERRELAATIADVALEQLTTRAHDRVSFHERAVEIAKAMPDVYAVSGPGFTNVYVACKADGSGWDDEAQVILDALADPKAHKEREKQAAEAG